MTLGPAAIGGRYDADSRCQSLPPSPACRIVAFALALPLPLAQMSLSMAIGSGPGRRISGESAAAGCGGRSWAPGRRARSLMPQRAAAPVCQA